MEQILKGENMKNKIKYTEGYDKAKEKNISLVDSKNIPNGSSPLTNALLKNNLFSVKKVNYDFNIEEEDIKIYSSGEYLFSDKVKLNPDSDIYHYKNTMIKIATLMPLDMRAFGMLVWLLDNLQKEKSNKLIFSINDIFDYLEYKPTSRKAEDKKNISNIILSLGSILLRVFIKESPSELRKKEAFYSSNSKVKSTSLYNIFNIDYDENTGFFKVVCSDFLYEIYGKSKWNVINIKEYKKLKTCVEKSIYKYLVFRDIGVNRKIGMELDLLYKSTGLNEYSKSEANRKFKKAMERFILLGIVKKYEIKSNRIVNIDLITSKNRKVIETNNEKVSKEDKAKNEKPESIFEEQIDFIDSSEYL